EAGRREAARILVVDDDTSVRAICREILTQAGYAVRDVGSSDAAVAEARRFRPELVMLDVMMPLIDGFRTAERLRADPATALTPRSARPATSSARSSTGSAPKATSSATSPAMTSSS